jgi:predicted amidohydrolase
MRVLKKVFNVAFLVFVMNSCGTKAPQKMNDLDLYLNYLTGTFSNTEQVENEKAKGTQIHPSAKHVTGLANHKIDNLPEKFNGQYVIEESYYTIPGKNMQVKHHLFLFSLTKDGKVNLRVQTPESLDNKLLTNDNNNLRFDFNQLKDVSRFKSTDYAKTDKGFYMKSPNDLGNGMKFTLEETIGDGFLEVMELLEKDGKSLTSYNTPMDRYKALALQITCDTINHCKSRQEADAISLKTLERIDKQIFASKTFVGQDLKLVVLPEYFLSGFPMGERIDEWKEKAALHFDGWEYQKLGEIAKRNGVFLSGNAYEVDPNFQDIYFQTSFIISDEGQFILRYRRLNSMFAPTPHDVLDKYIQVYGYESLFPVVKTKIGNLACIASEEILYPEIARCLMMRGAEIICHSSSEVGSPLLTQKNVAKLARAIENMAYVVSANSAGMGGTSIPFASTDGSSKIVDYKGLVLVEAGSGESMVANADIDLPALRYFRQRPAMGNLIARQRFELYAQSYANYQFYPPNTLIETPPTRQHFLQTQLEVIQKLTEKKII